MNFFDLIFSIIIIGFFLLSFARGSFKELFSTIGAVAGYLAAENFTGKYISIASQFIQDYDRAFLVTYIVIFILGLVLGAILSTFFKLFYSSQPANLPSRILGGLLGLVKAAVVIMVIFFIVRGYIPSFADDLAQSAYTPWLKSFHNLLSGMNLAFLDSIMA